VVRQTHGAALVDCRPMSFLERVRSKLGEIRKAVFLWRWRGRVKAKRFAHFGKRSLIYAPRGILAPHRIEIGDDVLIHEGAMFSVVERFNGREHEPWLRVGSGTNIGAGIWLSCVGQIEIGENNLMGHNVLIADSHHEYQDPDTPIIEQPMAWPEPVTIGPGCIIGPHVAILAGVNVGANSFIAANAVVTKSVPPNSVVVGNPAHVIRHYDRERGEWIDGPPAAA
jgi:acetyltransferase-like isoleucine patch superfamily enzyme